MKMTIPLKKDVPVCSQIEGLFPSHKFKYGGKRFLVVYFEDSRGKLTSIGHKTGDSFVFTAFGELLFCDQHPVKASVDGCPKYVQRLLYSTRHLSKRQELASRIEEAKARKKKNADEKRRKSLRALFAGASDI